MSLPDSGARLGATGTFRPSPSAEQLHRDNLQRDRLRAQLAAHLAANPSGATDQSGAPVVIPARTVNTAPALFAPADHLKALGLYRKSVKAPAVRTGYQPETVRAPVVFPWSPEQRLSSLSRGVSASWVALLTAVSTTSLGGGRLLGSQGRNLARIVEELRKRCYLRVSESGRPVQVREQVVLQVEGEKGQLAAACGMSASSFYRALQHPLAHMFIRTQKVQRENEAGDRQNVGTLFTVSMYEPLMPAAVEELYYSEAVENDGVYVVPALTCQSDGTKERPVNNQIQESPVENSKQAAAGRALAAQTALQNVLDGAELASKRGAAFDNSSTQGSGAAAAGAAGLDRLNADRPDLYAFAVEVAKYHDSKENRAAATVGYYKALLHLGAGVVRKEIQVIARWRRQGQAITNSGALLMSLLNKKARAATGFNIRDLGTVPGTVSA